MGVYPQGVVTTSETQQALLALNKKQLNVLNDITPPWATLHTSCCGPNVVIQGFVAQPCEATITDTDVGTRP